MKTELMKNSNQTRLPRRAAFTLVELLVVIAIMGILAALIFPAIGGIKARAARSKAQTELKQIETAIDSYKDKYGHYPPDNPGSPVLNQLFYELQGTFQTNLPGVGLVYQTLALNGPTNIFVASVSAFFGAGVGGFVNCTKLGGGDDFAAAQKFVSGLKPGQYGFLTTGVGLLTSSVPWPKNLGPVIPNAPPDLNPIRYNSSSPANNPKSYDLWVEIFIGGKTNRISNWSAQPEIVNY
jgi:prepilin-type N-terminal cleavage/methylation domain-containing protein